MNRRNFITGMAGILAAGYSASVLPSGVIMPVRKLWVPDTITVTPTFGLNVGDTITFHERGTSVTWRILALSGSTMPIKARPKSCNLIGSAMPVNPAPDTRLTPRRE